MHDVFMEDQRVLWLLSKVLELHGFVSIVIELMEGRNRMGFMVARGGLVRSGLIRSFESRCAVL